MGRNGKIRRAPGFEDRVGDGFERIDSAISKVRDFLCSYGYQPVETPLIEQTELFLRRSGGLLSSQLFDFTAPDGSDISLRPELTAPVIRHALEQNQGPLPWRYQYASPIFRYTERTYDASPSSVPNKRQFIQIGAELIGTSHPAADGEIIAMAYAMTQQLGIKDVTIRIGHVGLIWEVLGQFNLSDRARWFLANRVSEFRGCSDDDVENEIKAKRLGLMPNDGQLETQASAADLLTRLASGSVQLLRASETTGRTAEDVVAGLRRKLDSDISNVDFPQAMALMSEITSINNDSIESPHVAVEEDERLMRSVSAARYLDTIRHAEEVLANRGIVASRGIDNLRSTLDSAQSGGVDNLDISVDLGLATSMEYYSGMIFEVCALVGDKIVSIGGGGRYDGLAASLGSSSNLPALGFALNLDTILDLTRDSVSTEPRRRYILLVPFDDDSVNSVLVAASDLRAQGHSVVSLFEPEVDAQATVEILDDAEIVVVKFTDVASGTYTLVSA